MHQLYLTPEEKKLFDALSAEVQNGWKVEVEQLTFRDTEDQQRIRVEFMDVQDKNLRTLRDKAREVKSEADLAKLADSLDLANVSDSDIEELFFALGPQGITVMIVPLLEKATGDEEVDLAAMLSTARHILLESSSVPA
ncbi:MAG: hypothetical protein Q7R81_07865 [Candidatus Peregrinibacteria bacterium]|nr:hypothetical protein [Candidatus Peregrinibacteria bacterium]